MSAAAFENKIDGHDQLGWAMAVSLGLHLVVVAAVILWPAGEPDRQFFSPTYQVALVGSLPQSSGAASRQPAVASKPAPPKPKPVNKPEPVAETKPEPKPEPKPVVKPKPQPVPKEAIGDKKTVDPKKIKRVEKDKPEEPSAEELLDKRLKTMRSKVDSQRQLEDALARVEGKVQAAGAAGQDSGALARPGGVGGEMSNRFQLYYTELWERIRRTWVLPEALAGNTSGAMAVVVLRINRDGTLDKFWLEESSGNQRLDQSALRAVERAAPYPPLPGGYPGPYHEVGMRFRPEDAGL